MRTSVFQNSVVHPSNFKLLFSGLKCHHSRFSNDFLVVATAQTKAPLPIYVSSLSLILDSEGFRAVIKFQSPLSLLHWLSLSLWEAEKLGLPPVVVCLKDPEFSGNPSHYDRIHTCGAEREKKRPLLIHRLRIGGTSGLVEQLRHVCVFHHHRRLPMWITGFEHSHVKVMDCHSFMLLFHAYDRACAALRCPYENSIIAPINALPYTRRPPTASAQIAGIGP